MKKIWNMNKKLRTSLDVVLYVVVYLLLQFVVHLVGASIYAAVEGVDAQTVLAGMAVGEYGWLLAVEMVVSSGLAIWLFLRLRWAPVSRDYLASKPWTALVWVALLTLGLLLPSQWLYEQLQVSMSEDYQRLFEGILKEPWGYAAIGLLAPLAEEMVFRGARCLAFSTVAGLGCPSPSRHFFSLLCIGIWHRGFMLFSWGCSSVGCITARRASCPDLCFMG